MTAADLKVPAADRTLQVLEIIRQQSSTSIQSLLAQMDISRSSLYALLGTLKALGYIEQRGSRGSYQPGPRLIAWSHTSPLEPQELLTAFYEQMDSTPLNETAALVQLANGRMITLAQIESPQPVRVVLERGQEVPEELEDIATILGHNSIPPADGYILIEAGSISAIGLPVCRDGSHPDAALVVCAPLTRHPAQDLLAVLPELRETAARLSYRLGAQYYTPFQASGTQPMPYTRSLTADEIDIFLERPWAARLACIRPDGTPHVVPVWHRWDGEQLYLLAWPESHWASFIRSNPSVSITIDEPWPPHRRVSIRGSARPIEEPDLPSNRRDFIESFFLRYLHHPIPPEAPAWLAEPYAVQVEAVNGWKGLQTGSPDED